jgi:hypothetical protein
MILQDEFGRINFSAFRNLLMCVDAMEAEVRACLEGLDLAFQYSQLDTLPLVGLFQTLL